MLVPANRFEVLECRAAHRRGRPTTRRTRRRCAPARSTCSPSTCSACACAEPFDAGELYDEVDRAAPYRGADRRDFERVVDFVATGGYALKSYERFAKIRQGTDGRWRVAHPRVAQQYRLNVGTIVEAPCSRCGWCARAAASAGIPARRARRPRARRDRGIFHRDAAAPGDTFVFAGEILRYEGWSRTRPTSRAPTATRPEDPVLRGRQVPALDLSRRPGARACSPIPSAWGRCRTRCANGCRCSSERSLLPRPRELLVETFPRAARYYSSAIPFEGRLAHQTLGMLLTRRLERARLRAARLRRQRILRWRVWGLGDLGAAHRARRAVARRRCSTRTCSATTSRPGSRKSALMKRTFRNCAIIAGLIERRYPGEGEDAAGR